MNTFYVGSTISLAATFNDPSGGVVDPTAVTAEIITPDGETTDLTSLVEHLGQGNYRVRYPVVQSGLHIYRLAGTGSVPVAGEGSFMGQTAFSG